MTTPRTADRFDADFSDFGMIALWPASDYAEMLAIPGGLDPDDLHLEVVTLGPYITDPRDPDLNSAVSAVASRFSQIQANVYGHAVLDPYRYQPRAAYLVGHSDNLDMFHQEMLAGARAVTTLPTQRDPWTPHITAAYENNDANALGFTGSLQFDRAALVLGGDIEFFPLLG